MTKLTDTQILRLNGFLEHDGYWYAPGDWADEAGPWQSAKAALKWLNKNFF